jgi:hypothetical protein
VIAGNHKDIAVGVGERIERRLQGQRVLERGIDVGIVGIDIPAILLVVQIGFDALAKRVAGVLKKFMSDERTRDRQNVVRVERAKAADGPIHLSLRNVKLTSQAGLKGIRHDLLKVGVPDKGVVDQTRPKWIRAGQLQRRRGSICFGKIAVERQIRRQLVGRSDHGIKVSVGVTAAERGVIAERVAQVDLGEVEATACGD